MGPNEAFKSKTVEIEVQNILVEFVPLIEEATTHYYVDAEELQGSII